MADFSSGSWLNDPADWALEDGTLHVTTGEKSDFWRHTHYGFVRDNGHFWQLAAPRTFTQAQDRPKSCRKLVFGLESDFPGRDRKLLYYL